jgi:hypothetical protein
MLHLKNTSVVRTPTQRCARTLNLKFVGSMGMVVISVVTGAATGIGKATAQLLAQVIKLPAGIPPLSISCSLVIRFGPR